MSDIQFSTGLFKQLGGTLYLSRPAYFQGKSSAVPLQLSSHVVSGRSNKVSEDLTHSSKGGGVELAKIDLSESTELSTEAVTRSRQQECSVVIIGSGLSSIWEDDSKLEWQLLQNICHAFGWTEDNLDFFDTDLLISEEIIFTTMEEVIDLGVEWVLSMDSDHVISEQLAEGVQVIEVPSLDQMLSDAYAKQSFYQSVSPLTSIS